MYSYLAKVQQTQPQLISQAGGTRGSSQSGSNNNNRSAGGGGGAGVAAGAGDTGQERDRERDQRWIQRQEEYSGQGYDDVS